MPMPSKSALLVVAGLSLTTAASSASGIPLAPPGPDMSLYSTSPAFTDGWGTSIAMGNGFIVVGAPNDDTAGPNRGSVSVIWVNPACTVVLRNPSASLAWSCPPT